MKILLALTDQSFTATKSLGIFNVSIGLAKGLMQCEGISELHILGNEECAPYFGELPSHVHIHLSEKPVPKQFARLYWDQIGIQRAINRVKPDWAILPKGFPPYFPRLGKTKIASYVHDIIWEYYKNLPAGNESPFPPHQLAYFSSLGIRALEVSNLVLTSTLFNRGRFEAYRPGCHCAVVGIGFDGEPCPALNEKRGRDILSFVSPYPHKQTPLILDYLQQWLAQRVDREGIRIHLVGQLPSNCQLPDTAWIPHQRIPQAELSALIKASCRATTYASAYEGYGMPPVESLRLGIPCVASDIAPIRENIPPKLLFDNESAQDFISKLNHAYDEDNTTAYPSYPNWQEVAEKTLHAMRATK